MDYVNAIAFALLVLLWLIMMFRPRWSRVLRKHNAPPPKKGDLPWAPAIGNRCKARLKRGVDPEFFGQCELQADHYSDMWEDHHALERGMVNVRWDNAGNVRYEQS